MVGRGPHLRTQHSLAPWLLQEPTSPLLLSWWETEAQRGTEMHLKPQWPGSGHPQGPWTQPLPGSTGQGALAC